jgi:hypothetical protein
MGWLGGGLIGRSGRGEDDNWQRGAVRDVLRLRKVADAVTENEDFYLVGKIGGFHMPVHVLHSPPPIRAYRRTCHIRKGKSVSTSESTVGYDESCGPLWSIPRNYEDL